MCPKCDLGDDHDTEKTRMIERKEKGILLDERGQPVGGIPVALCTIL